MESIINFDEFFKFCGSQVKQLNTNSRYLHDKRELLGQKLVETFKNSCAPDLQVVFFVNSGSEANDLALRLAQAHTKNKHAIVVERAYHGHTMACIDLSSPYKFKDRSERADYVSVVPCPCVYQGEHRDAASYAKYVEDICEKEKKICAFFIESGFENFKLFQQNFDKIDQKKLTSQILWVLGMSLAGVILPPEGYLQKCYAAVRKAGGVCVADEVQVLRISNFQIF